MTWLRRGFKAFRRYAARTLRHRWTRDHTCNVQIPTVCSLWHRHSEHQTWTTHRYWFCLSPLWQQQDSPYRILSLVSIYFIIMYLVCTFSVAVFGPYVSGDFKRESWLYKGLWIGGLSESFGFGSSHFISPMLLFQLLQSEKIWNIPAHIPLQITLLRSKGNIACNGVVRSMASSHSIYYTLFSRCELYMEWRWKILFCSVYKNVRANIFPSSSLCVSWRQKQYVPLIRL